MTTAYKINANGHVVSPAIQAAAAALMAKLNDPEVLFDASLTDTWRKTIAQGHTDGKPAYTPLDTPRKPAYVDFQDSVNTEKSTVPGMGQNLHTGNGTFLPEPERPDAYHCLDFGAKARKAGLWTGEQIATPLDCDECANCVEWRKQLKRIRYALALPNCDQTMITIRGFAEITTARAWAKQQGRRSNAPRVSVMSKKAGQYTLRVVYAFPLNTRAATLALRDMERKGYDGSVDTLRVSGDDFLDMLPDARTIDDGDKRRRVVSFSRNWPVTFVDRPPRYLEDNGTVVTRLADAVAERQLPLWAEHRERTSPEVAATLNAGDWLSQIDGPIPADKWAALCTAIKERRSPKGAVIAIMLATLYAGPSALLVDAAKALMGRVEYRECYAEVYGAVDYA